jgi:hypothetical protein
MPALMIQRSQIAFARCLDRCRDYPLAGCGEDSVESVGVLGTSVLDQELQAVGARTEVA